MSNTKCKIYYINVGEGEHRNWDDFKNFGFISAGHGPKYSKAISTLSVGDKVIAYLKGFGYVGVGVVTEEAVKAIDFSFAGAPLSSLKLTSENFFAETSDELSEYVVKVNWLAAYDRQFSKWQSKSGLFTTPAIKASLVRQVKTIEFIESEFGVTLLNDSERADLHALSEYTEAQIESTDVGSGKIKLDDVSGNAITYVEYFKLPSQPTEGQDFDDEFAIFNYFIEKLSFTVYETDEGTFYQLSGGTTSSLLFSEDNLDDLLSELKKRIDSIDMVPESLKNARFILALFETAISGDNDVEAAYEFLGDIDIEFEYDVDDVSDSYADHFGCRIWKLESNFTLNQDEDNKVVLSSIDYNGEEYSDIDDAIQDAEFEEQLTKTIAIVGQAY